MIAQIWFTTLALVYALDPVKDKVVKWVGYPDDVTFNSYTGQIPLSSGKQSFHYIFMESMRDPTKDPVIIWLGGGPGCSCLLGLIREIGPYIVMKEDLEGFKENPNSLHKIASVLYLEVPAGVGYSTQTDPDFVWTDTTTGTTAYQAVRLWFEAFKEFNNLDYYIGGESYSGMYVPYLAAALTEGEKSQRGPKINLKGIMIGNGVIPTEEEFFDENNLNFMADRSFFDPTTTKVIDLQCQIKPDSPSCKQAKRNVRVATQHINPYNVYDYCWGDSTTVFGKGDQVKEDNSDAPCIDPGPMHNYFNKIEVQEAMHVTEGTRWEACNMDIFAKYKRDPAGSQALHPYLNRQGVRIMHYSGNQDDVVSVDYTINGINLIPGIQETKPWTAFKRTVDGQLGGWTIEYNYLSLYIVRGAGHMVPFDQAAVAFQIFSEFINKKDA